MNVGLGKEHKEEVRVQEKEGRSQRKKRTRAGRMEMHATKERKALRRAGDNG